MTVADYVLAAVALLACAVWAAGSFLMASIDAFAPAPNAETGATSRKGCASLVLALLAIAYFIGVLVSGGWGWIT